MRKGLSRKRQQQDRSHGVGVPPNPGPPKVLRLPFLSSLALQKFCSSLHSHARTRVCTHMCTHIYIHTWAQHTLILEECGEGHYERLHESPWKVSFLKPAPVRVDGTQEAPSFKEMHRTLGTAEGTERQAWRQQVGGGWRAV